MRTLKLFMAIVATSVALSVLGGTTVAQDQSATTTHVTGVSSGGQTLAEGTPGDTAFGVRGAVYEHVIDWSDPRLPNVLRFSENYDVHLTGDDPGAVISVVSSVRLEGPEGSWSGFEYGLIEELEAERTSTRLIVLSGAGAYEGMSAMLTHGGTDYAKPVFDGYIFEAEMTPLPEALKAFDVVAEVVPEAVAQADPSPVPASEMTFVTGTESCGPRTPPIQVAADGGWDAQASVATCQNDMSDPRVSGAWTNTLDARCFGKDLCVLWGTSVLDGPDGGWECSWSGSNYPVGEREFGYWPILLTAVCPGTGGYEGLTYVFQHATVDLTEGSSFNGVIYEGPPPG